MGPETGWDTTTRSLSAMMQEGGPKPSVPEDTLHLLEPLFFPHCLTHVWEPIFLPVPLVQLWGLSCVLSTRPGQERTSIPLGVL